MVLTVKDTGENGSLEPVLGLVHVGRNHSLVKDLSPGELGVQVDVFGQDEVLVVIGGRLAEGDQVGRRGDLKRILGRAAAPAVFGRSGRNDDQKEQTNAESPAE